MSEQPSADQVQAASAQKDDPGSAPESGEHDIQAGGGTGQSGTSGAVQGGSSNDDVHYAPESGDLPDAG